MEEKRLSDGEIAKILDNYEAQNFSAEAIELGREDLRYGLTAEQIDIYYKKRLNINQMRHISRALRAGVDMSLIEMVIEEQFAERQMEAIFDYHLKGIPADDLKGNITKDMNAHAIKKALDDVLAGMKEAKESKGIVDEKAQEILSHIESMVNGISSNSDYLQEVLTKLETLDNIEKNSDDVREKLAKSVEEKERIIREQQNLISQTSTDRAKVRDELKQVQADREQLVKEKAQLEAEVTRLQTENESLRKEKEDMERHVLDKNKELEKQEEAIRKVSSMPKTDYDTEVVFPNGNRQMVHVERTLRKSPDNILALAGKKLFKSKSRVNLIKHLTGKGLNQEQMAQVKAAIESGLTDEEVIDIINSGFSAAEMEQAIQIVVAEKMYQ